MATNASRAEPWDSLLADEEEVGDMSYAYAGGRRGAKESIT